MTQEVFENRNSHDDGSSNLHRCSPTRYRNSQVLNKFISIESRLSSIDSTLASLPKRSWLDIFNVIAPVILVPVMFVVGYIVKDVVAIEQKEREIALASATAVQALVQNLAKSELSPSDRVAVAVALAEYGHVAVAPLVRQLAIEQDSNARAVMAGIRAVAIIEHNATCVELGKMLSDQRPLYPEWAHIRAIKLLGALKCTFELSMLIDYRNKLSELGMSNPEAFAKRIFVPDGCPSPTPDLILVAADNSIHILKD